MRSHNIKKCRQSQTLIKLGRGNYMAMIKQKDKTPVPLAGKTAFIISRTRQAATKYLLPQQWHPAQASVNKE